MNGHTYVLRDFPLATSGAGAVAHYVDDYRYRPGRTLCGRWLSTSDAIGTGRDLPLCGACARRDNYPTKDEFYEYHTCTECGVDTWTLGEAGYTVRDAVWNTAYPLYRRGVGVGSTRPCLNCLQQRLGRALTAEDFILPPYRDNGAEQINHPPTGVPAASRAILRRTARRFLRLIGRSRAVDSGQHRPDLTGPRTPRPTLRKDTR